MDKLVVIAPAEVSLREIQSRIYTIRGVQVMLDSDLAMLYHVETRVFNQAVKRNEERFPDNFRFQLTGEEHRTLLSRIEATERRQLKQKDAQQRNEERFDQIFDAMRDKKFPPQTSPSSTSNLADALRLEEEDKRRSTIERYSLK